MENFSNKHLTQSIDFKTEGFSVLLAGILEADCDKTTPVVFEEILKKVEFLVNLTKHTSSKLHVMSRCSQVHDIAPKYGSFINFFKGLLVLGMILFMPYKVTSQQIEAEQARVEIVPPFSLLSKPRRMEVNLTMEFCPDS